MISKRADGYYVLAESKGKDGKHKKLGGPYNSLEQAKKRLAQVEMFKHMKAPKKR